MLFSVFTRKGKMPRHNLYSPRSQLSSVAQLCPTLCNPMDYTAHQALLSITISQSLLKLMSIELVMPPNHLILCHPLSSCLQSFPSSGSFLMSQFFASGQFLQRIGVSASTSVLPMNMEIVLRGGRTQLAAPSGPGSHIPPSCHR